MNREQLDDILRSDMDSRSSRPEAGAARARPSRALLARLRAGKAALREHRIALPLPDKVRQLLQLQHIQVVMLAKRRPHRPWERPWDVEP